MENPNFDREWSQFLESAGKSRIMVLSTAAGNRVTSRSMSCVFHKGRVYLQTGREMTKFRQLTENPNVALCYDNVQIEGVARPLGHPLEEGNRFFAELYRECHAGSFAAYSALPEEVAVEIRPTLVTVWEYREGKPFRLQLDCVHQRAQREAMDSGA